MAKTVPIPIAILHKHGSEKNYLGPDRRWCFQGCNGYFSPLPPEPVEVPLNSLLGESDED